ncbi:MAG: PAS and helix-turn-helix domain-containing protein [Oligoflexia bacterium]|nr:PAS and helix-turn-helix domain-containing protein [Oligoflexia bacterium]
MEKKTKSELIKIISALNKQVNRQKVLEMELMQIFNTSADGMRVIDKNFNTLRVNDTFLDLAKVKREDVKGKKCFEIFKGPLCHTDDCPITKIINGEKRFEAEVLKSRCDGSFVPCIITATPFVDDKGVLIGVVEDFKDISERKSAEEKIKKANLELEETNCVLKKVLSHIEEEKIALKDNINLNVEKNIKPILQRIKKNLLHDNAKLELLELLEKNLSFLYSDYYRKTNSFKLKLSPMETKIGQLIRSGHQAKEIADFLNIAVSTVQLHKERIRKKLGLTNKPINLKTYLHEMFE